MDLSIFSDPQSWVSLATLTAMEIVLGIDNIVFISILTGKLPPERQALARNLGLGLALGSRLALLFAISWVMGLTRDLFTIDLPGLDPMGFSGRDLILLAGGLFLVGKATHEIYDKLEVDHGEGAAALPRRVSLNLVLTQIILIDIVFSFDSVITAVGMARHIIIMVIAMVISVVVMLAAAGSISDFVHRHPSMKILALSFLILIGVMLTAEGFGQHINKGYIYFAMAFSLLVEIVNMRIRRSRAPVVLGDKVRGEAG